MEEHRTRPPPDESADPVGLEGHCQYLMSYDGEGTAADHELWLFEWLLEWLGDGRVREVRVERDVGATGRTCLTIETTEPYHGFDVPPYHRQLIDWLDDNVSGLLVRCEPIQSESLGDVGEVDVRGEVCS